MKIQIFVNFVLKEMFQDLNMGVWEYLIPIKFGKAFVEH